MKKKGKKTKNGYILLEIIVSLGIFMAVIAVGMSAVLILFDSNKRAQDLKSIINNLNIAMDSMTREIVVGTIYQCTDDDVSSISPNDCSTNGNTQITFCSSDDEPIAYKFDANSIQRRVGEISGGGDCELGEPITWDGWIRITAPEVTIEYMKFYVSGAELVFLQPRVLVKVEGKAGTAARETEFEIQTTVSQRVPDLSIVPTN